MTFEAIKALETSCSSTVNTKVFAHRATVLSDVEPTSPDFTVKKPLIYVAGTSQKTTVTFNKINVSFQDFRDAYALLNKRGKSRPNILRPVDQAIVVAIRKLGGIPVRGKGEFWEKVKNELANVGKQLPEPVASALTKLSPDAIRVRVSNLKKKGIGDELFALIHADEAES